ncbi:hypothetical protein JYT79_02135 [Cardiobacterium sp. AH-315-I02]|nr:hypothetical protein [Cardiobacterium sp. AH-315-I02]
MILHNRSCKHTVVQLEIEVEKLEVLFSNGELCVSDVRPLNSQSKSSLWNLCLSSCVKRLRCNIIHVESPGQNSYKVSCSGSDLT